MKLFKITCFLFIASIMFTTTGCKKEVDGCTDPNAENFNADADNDDGSCVLAREKFIGSYAVNEACGSGNYNYNITITESSNGEEFIIINNFGDYAVNVIASVSGSSINVNDTKSTITFSGSGNLSGSTLSIIYTASQGANSDSCTMTCIKQ